MVATTVSKKKDVGKSAADKGEPISVKLFRSQARKLSELAYEEGLAGGAAEAFDKHFAAILDNLLIAAKDASLKRLRDGSQS